MKLVRLLKGAFMGAALGAGLSLTPVASSAQETFRVGVCYDLSRSYTFISPQVVQAAQDLAALINLDGGIGGHPIEVIVQDHGNEPVVSSGFIGGVKKSRFNEKDFGVIAIDTHAKDPNAPA